MSKSRATLLVDIVALSTADTPLTYFSNIDVAEGDEKAQYALMRLAIRQLRKAGASVANLEAAFHEEVRS